MRIADVVCHAWGPGLHDEMSGGCGCDGTGATEVSGGWLFGLLFLAHRRR